MAKVGKNSVSNKSRRSSSSFANNSPPVLGTVVVVVAIARFRFLHDGAINRPSLPGDPPGPPQGVMAGLRAAGVRAPARRRRARARVRAGVNERAFLYEQKAKNAAKFANFSIQVRVNFVVSNFGVANRSRPMTKFVFPLLRSPTLWQTHEPSPWNHFLEAGGSTVSEYQGRHVPPVLRSSVPRAAVAQPSPPPRRASPVHPRCFVVPPRRGL